MRVVDGRAGNCAPWIRSLGLHMNWGPAAPDIGRTTDRLANQIACRSREVVTVGRVQQDHLVHSDPSRGSGGAQTCQAFLGLGAASARTSRYHGGIGGELSSSK